MAEPDLITLQYVACQLPPIVFLEALIDRFMITGWFRMPFLVRSALLSTFWLLLLSEHWFRGFDLVAVILHLPTERQSGGY
jgi:hypothetical protein